MKKARFILSALLLLYCVGMVKAHYAEMTPGTAEAIQNDTFTRGFLNYTVLGTGDDLYLAVSAKGTVVETNVVIPDTVIYDGTSYEVRTIRDFAYQTNIAHFEIGKNVRTIEKGAFINCISLQSVTIPANVESLGERIFAGCKSLKSLTIEAGTKLKQLPLYLLSETKVRSFDIPEGIITVDKNCFSNAWDLQEITIASTLEDPFAVLKSVKNLTTVKVHDDDPNNSAYDGVLYDKALTTIVFVPQRKTTVSFPATITEIPDYAFQWSLLTELNLPPTIVKIGKGCFEYSDSLKTVVMPGVTTLSEGAFYSCEALERVTLSDDITVIPNACFRVCSKLTNINIPKSTKIIGDLAFDGCSSLAAVNLPEGLTTIGSEAFACDTSLTEITIPNTVTSFYSQLGYGGYGRPFRECKNLRAINFKEGSQLTYIPEEFYAGTGVRGTVNVHEGIVRVERKAFGDSISVVNLPSTVTNLGNEPRWLEMRGWEIGPSAPYNINGAALQAVNISAQNRTFTSKNGILFSKDQKELLLFPSGKTDESYTTPASVETIGDYAFWYTRLASVIVSEGVKEIKDHAFDNNDYGDSYAPDNLKSVTLPSTLATLGKGAFEYQKSLESISFPTGIKVINDEAFSNCSALSIIEMNGAEPIIGEYAFAGTKWMDSQDNGLVYLGTTLLTYKGTIKDNISITVKEGTKTIANSAFNNDNSRMIFGVTLPQSLVRIGVFAFASTSLKGRVVIPDNVTTIGKQAFNYYSDPYHNPTFFLGKSVQTLGQRALGYDLSKISVSTENPYLVKNDYMLYNKQSGDVFLCDLSSFKDTLRLPDDITNLDPDYIIGADSITTLVFGKNMKYAEESSDKEFYFWEERGDYGRWSAAFENLKAYAVADGNTDFAVVDGVLYNKAKTVLLAYPHGKEDTVLTMPSSVVEIGPSALMWCTHLRKAVLSPNTVKIGKHAFFGCWKMSEIDLGKRLEELAADAFGGCNIKSITVPSSFRFLEFMAHKNFYEIENITFNTIGDIKINAHLMDDHGSYGDWTIHYPCVNTVTIYNYTPNISLDPYPFIYSNGDIERVDSCGEGMLKPNELYFTVVNDDGVRTNYVVVENDADTTSTDDDDTPGSKVKRYMKFNIRAIAHAATQNGVRAHARKIVITDGSVFSTPIPIEAEETQMNVPINTKWQTIALPFNGTIPEGAEVAELNAAGEITAGGAGVSFSKVTGGLKAGKAYLIRNTSQSALDAIQATNDVVEAFVEQDSTAQFIANMDSTITFNEAFLSRKENIGYRFYGFDESIGQFRLMTGTDKCPTYRCYLKVGSGLVTTAGGNTAMTIGTAVEGKSIATSINTVTAKSSHNDAPAYNLAGQRVGSSYKGVVLKENRKYINK